MESPGAKEAKILLWEENRAFFQANLVKGGRYLDDAGKIINDYAQNYYSYNVGVDGLHFGDPKVPQMPDEIATNIDRIWLACYGEDCVERIMATAASIAANISRHIAVNTYNRLGLRVLYFKPADDLGRYCRQVCSRLTSREFQALMGSVDKVREMGLGTRFVHKPFVVSLRLQPISITRPAAKKSDFAGNGMVIDIDVGEDNDSSTRTFNRGHLVPFLTESLDVLRQKAEETILFLRGVDQDA